MSRYGITIPLGVPDRVVDDLIVPGTPDQCRAKIQRDVDCGVDPPMLGIMPWGLDPGEAARQLRPA